MTRNVHEFSSSPEGDEPLLEETTCSLPSFSPSMLEDIERQNRLSANISLRQLDLATALIRAG